MTWRWFAAAVAACVAITALAVHDTIRSIERALRLPEEPDE